MANRKSPQSPPLQDQVPNQKRIGIEILLDPDVPELLLALCPVAGDDGSDNFLELFYGEDVEAVEEWAKVTKFMMGGLRFAVEESETAIIFRDFLLIMLGTIWQSEF